MRRHMPACDVATRLDIKNAMRDVVDMVHRDGIRSDATCWDVVRDAMRRDSTRCDVAHDTIRYDAM